MVGINDPRGSSQDEGTLARTFREVTPPEAQRFSSHPDVRRALISFFIFALLELWVYLAAFQDPFADSSGRIWEGPLSLFLLFLAFLFAIRSLSSLRYGKILAGGFALSLMLFIAAAWVPLTPPTATTYSLVVYKSQRKLEFYQDGRLQAEFRISLGGHPVGDKQVMSDAKTPLGQFRVCDKGHGMFHRWIGLNYPTTEDAWRGRQSAKISWGEWWVIRVANLNGRVPYGNSALGGAIGIHGGGAGKDWTLGCVALENKDIETIFDEIPLGTEVEIRS